MTAQKEKQKNMGAGTRLSIRERFTAKRIALMAVFVALAYAVSFLEIPMPLFGASFLKLDFGNVFIVLISFLLGPLEGVLVCAFKEGLRCFTSTSFCAGELANFFITATFLLLPAIVYSIEKTFKLVCITLSLSCLLATVAACFANQYLICPAYAYVLGGDIFGMTVQEAFMAFWPAIVVFNLIKTGLISLLTGLLYKRLSNFLKKMKI